MRTVAYFIALALMMPEPVHAASVAVKSCLIIGAGVAKRVAKYKPECDVVALDKRSSARILDNIPARYYPKIIISAGGNDPLNPKLGQNLFAIRRKVRAGTVVWLAPYDTKPALRVFEVATQFHDRIVYLGKFKKNYAMDGHPKDYKAVAKAL